MVESTIVSRPLPVAWKGIWIVHQKTLPAKTVGRFKHVTWKFKELNKDAQLWWENTLNQYDQWFHLAHPKYIWLEHLTKKHKKNNNFKKFSIKIEESPQVMIYLPHTAMPNCIKDLLFFCTPEATLPSTPTKRCWPGTHRTTWRFDGINRHGEGWFFKYKMIKGPKKVL